jgi:peptidoglycan/LPS O-acetylase OafA/YrhL
LAEENTIQAIKPRSSDVPVLYSLRAIAALSVCFFHYVCTTTGLFHNKYLLAAFSPGKYGVEMFFVISGFVIPWSMYNGGYTFKKFFTFLFKRLLRLEPPYIASLITVIIILLLREKYIEHPQTSAITVTRVLLHFGYMIPFFTKYTWLNQVYWTLAVEFQFYFFMAFVYLPLVKGKLWGRIIFYAAVLCSAYFFNNEFLPKYLPFFMLGIILFLKKTEQMTTAEFYISSAIMILACIYKFHYAPTLYATFAFIAIAFFEKKDNKITHSLGEVSYSIYLFHPLIGATLVNVLSHNTHTPVMKALLVLAGIAVTLISAYIMYWLVERPSKRLSSKLKYRPT